MSLLYSDCLEKTQIRTDMQPPLVTSTTGGVSLAADSVVTTAVLNYIDYERKKLLANQGTFVFSPNLITWCWTRVLDQYRKIRGNVIEIFKIIHQKYDASCSPTLQFNNRVDTNTNCLIRVFITTYENIHLQAVPSMPGIVYLITL